MIDLDILVNPDQEGNPENTTRRMPESNNNLDDKDIVRKISQVEEVLDSARDSLIYFVMSLPAPEQVFMIQQATIPWLKDLDVIKAYVAEKPIVNAGDQVKDDDTTTITTGEDNMADIEIPHKRKLLISIKEASMLLPSQLTLQVALEDPSSLSKLKKRVTKTRKLFTNSRVEFLAISMTQ